MHRAQGNYNQALHFYETALKINIDVLGEEHPTVAADHNKIGITLKLTENYDLALQHYETGLAIAKATLPANHSVIRAIRHNLKKCFEAQNRDQAYNTTIIKTWLWKHWFRRFSRSSSGSA